MSIPPRKKARRNPRGKDRSPLESLESRVMLASDALNVFATFDGVIPMSNGSATIGINVAPADFTLAGGASAR